MSELNEKCGIFGIFGRNLECSQLVYLGLWALQHRGQESSGIASADGNKIYVHKGRGLVAHVFEESVFNNLNGHIAVGHNRYSTSKGSDDSHNQPVFLQNAKITLAHNGNLPSTKKLEKFLFEKGIDYTMLNDSEMMAAAIEYYYEMGLTIEEAIKSAYPLFSGAFSILVMTKDKLVALRDKCGIRPLSIGKLGNSYVFSSETCALDIINAAYVRDVNPGEMVIAEDSGLRFQLIEKGEQKLDIFEFVYFARPDSILLGKRVNSVRYNFGVELAKLYKIEADIVIPVPDSAIPAAEGYAAQSGIDYRNGLIKNRYVHRTFIHPGQTGRDQKVSMKFNPIPETLFDKRVIIIDDSIVRGTTSRKLVERIFLSGAKEVHMLIASPPVLYPDFYGIDTPEQSKLIAATLPIDKIKEYIGVTSLNYLTLEGMITATELPAEYFSLSCFNGVYPIELHERANEIKDVSVTAKIKKQNNSPKPKEIYSTKFVMQKIP